MRQSNSKQPRCVTIVQGGSSLVDAGSTQQYDMHQLSACLKPTPMAENKIVHDRFHVMQLANMAVDKLHVVVDF